jgi:hypothetical protein
LEAGVSAILALGDFMSKLAMHSALPRRSLYVDENAKPAGFTRLAPVAVGALFADNVSTVTPAVPVSFPDWLDKHGVKADDAGVLLGVGKRTGFRWSSGETALPPLAQACMALIDHIGIDAAHIVLSGLAASE